MSAAVQLAARLLAERTGMDLRGGLRQRLATCLDGQARASGQPPNGSWPGWAATRSPSSGCWTA
jgi:hypothetical protein